jgi:hypothetical protein
MSAEAVMMPVQPLEQTEYVGHHRAAEEATAQASWRARLGQIAGRAALVLGVAAGGTAALNMDTRPAEASSVSCYGDYCSGQYADDTGCDQDARTIAEANINQEGASFNVNAGPVGMGWTNGVGEVAKLEVRTSDACGTVWARLNARRPNPIQIIGVKHDGGYSQTRVISHLQGSPAAVSISPMIYARGRNVHAFVKGMGDEDGTYWVERS